MNRKSRPLVHLWVGSAALAVLATSDSLASASGDRGPLAGGFALVNPPEPTAAPVDPPVAPPPAANPGGGAPVKKVRVKDARYELSRLADLLRNKQSENADILAAIDAVKAAYDHLAPDLVRDATTGTDVEDVKGFEAAKKAFHADAEKEFYRALTLTKVVAPETNARDDVNVKAAQTIAGDRYEARERAVKELAAFMETTVPARQKSMKVPPALYAAVFGALGAIADEENGGVAYLRTWIKFDNTGDLPVRIRAAYDAMTKVKAIHGHVRHEFALATVILFSPIESAAEHPSATDASTNPKAYWDPMRPSVIRMLQVFCREPKEKDGGLMSTVAAFEIFLRAHKDVRKAPWSD